jgi:hypothetical protein
VLNNVLRLAERTGVAAGGAEGDAERVARCFMFTPSNVRHRFYVAGGGGAAATVSSTPGEAWAK